MLCLFGAALSLREKCNGTKFKSRNASFSLSADISPGAPKGHNVVRLHLSSSGIYNFPFVKKLPHRFIP